MVVSVPPTGGSSAWANYGVCTRNPVGVLRLSERYAIRCDEDLAEDPHESSMGTKMPRNGAAWSIYLRRR